MKLNINRQIVIFLLLLGSHQLLSQDLSYKRGRLYQDGKVVAPSEWKSVFEGNSEALVYASKAKSNYGTSQTLGFIGGFLIGWPIGTALGGGEPEWAMLGAGAGIVAIAIPIASGVKKNMKKAIQLQSGSSSSSRASAQLFSTGSNIGLRLTF